MSSLNNFFEKIFVIALKEDRERIRSVNENLKGLRFEFAYGVNMKHLYPHVKSNAEIPLDFFQHYEVNRDQVLHWSLGGLGCGVSHRNVIKHIVENNIAKSLILEDDVFLAQDIDEVFNGSIHFLPKDWELLYFGYDSPTKFHNDFYRPFGPMIANFKPIRVLQYDGRNFSKNFFPKKVNKYIDRAGVYMGGHAYAITLEGAKKLLAENTPMHHCADCLLINVVYHKKVRAYSLRRPVVYQNKSLGSNTDGSFKPFLSTKY